MDQVSLPMRVLLIGTLAFAAIWFVALRPKAGAERGGSPAAPAQPTPAPKSALPGGLGNSVDTARTARSQGDEAAAAPPAKVDAAADPAPAPAAKPAPDPSPAAKPATRPVRAGAGSGPLATVARHLARGRVVVLLFHSSGSDDRLVRGQVAGVSRRGGRVYVKSVPVRRLSRYREALQGAQVLQTPSVVMLRRGHDPVLLAGYTDRAEVDQIAAALLRRR